MENIQSIFRLLPRVKSVINKVISNLNFWWVSFCYIFCHFTFFRQYTLFFEKRKQKAKEFLGRVSLANGLGLWYHNREIEKKKQRGFVYGKIIFQIRRDGQLQIGTGTHYEIQLRGTGDARLADEACGRYALWRR